MKCVVLVLSLLVSLTGADDPERCCMADQFSAVFTDLSSGNKWTSQIDFTDLKSEFMLCTTNEQTACGKVLTNYETNIIYWMPAAGGCTQMDSTVSPYQCTPDSATFNGSDYVGEARYDKWLYRVNSNTMSIIGFYPDGCIPVTHETHITLGDNSIQYNRYTIDSYQTGLSDPDEFNLPAACTE